MGAEGLSCCAFALQRRSGARGLAPEDDHLNEVLVGPRVGLRKPPGFRDEAHEHGVEEADRYQCHEHVLANLIGGRTMVDRLVRYEAQQYHRRQE